MCANAKFICVSFSGCICGSEVELATYATTRYRGLRRLATPSAPQALCQSANMETPALANGKRNIHLIPPASRPFDPYYTPLYYLRPVPTHSGGALAHTLKGKRKLLNRVRRIKGQVEAIERALEAEADCADVMQQITSCRGA